MRDGIVFIGVAQEKAQAFNGKKVNGQFEFNRDKAVYVNHYYFYIDDEDFGPLFIKVCSYAPWGTKFAPPSPMCRCQGRDKRPRCLGNSPASPIDSATEPHFPKAGTIVRNLGHCAGPMWARTGLNRYWRLKRHRRTIESPRIPPASSIRAP